ncbi:MAG: hypothetical protein IGR93_09280 [Hydrococcus sp. C42_A2020_068]|uniref:hypothetical protein n=1 Tax=Pleurocapsa sp. PCC 7327 TaxID=118163 RepID=UPI00029FFE9A|nr:hypothetical protein [Pleurocapsa sp. PCC 7327]AFY78569.1 hypothetical protein Ple7327_3353 [Pleurocapsa sp. PCC 7327]MBF2020277.1 hypothetical protein [Hydrococcus sp. C42_A2020_068]
MKKVLLTLLASSVSLAVILLAIATARADAIASRNIKSAISGPVVQFVNLNLANFSFNAIDPKSYPILHQWGCSCTACTEPSRQLSLIKS